MSATLTSGNVTYEVSAKVEAFRLVKAHEGKIQHNDAATFPLGVVTAPAEPMKREEGSLAHGYPDHVNVVCNQCVVKIETDGELTVGAAVYAAADGKVSASGSVKVGFAERPTLRGKTRVHLFHPSVLVG